MRGDLALQVRLLARPRGVLGMAAVLAGAAATVAVYLPWYEVRATVAMLGHARARTVAALPGWQAQPWVWTVAALAVVSVVVGLSLAVDRPARSASKVLIVVAVGIAAISAASAVLRPPQGRFRGQQQFDELHAVISAVPADVTVRFSVHPTTGLWVALGAAAVLLTSALSTGEE
ncbi:MAG: hypothetical protein KY462_04660 [Actinobacteria bacterium]|nr:hypothetical protein [Actinomycetota bacterium]